MEKMKTVCCRFIIDIHDCDAKYLFCHSEIKQKKTQLTSRLAWYPHRMTCTMAHDFIAAVEKMKLFAFVRQFNVSSLHCFTQFRFEHISQPLQTQQSRYICHSFPEQALICLDFGRISVRIKCVVIQCERTD